MKKTSLIALAAALAIAASPVAAADLIVDVPVVDEASSFDWEGLYVGGFLGYFPWAPSATVGLELGYNVVFDNNVLVGVETSGLFYLDGSQDDELFVNGKLGAALDNVAIYTTAGLGTYNLGLALWSVGAGVEVALTDSLTWNVQLSGRNTIGSLPTVPHVQTGLRFHF